MRYAKGTDGEVEIRKATGRTEQSNSYVDWQHVACMKPCAAVRLALQRRRLPQKVRWREMAGQNRRKDTSKWEDGAHRKDKACKGCCCYGKFCCSCALIALRSFPQLGPEGQVGKRDGCKKLFPDIQAPSCGQPFTSED